MGGSGSGRQKEYNKSTAETSSALSLSSLRQAGLLKPGGVFSSKWSRGGEQKAAISGVVSQDLRNITLHYRHRDRWKGDEWEEVTQVVPLVYTRCRFGGRRAWFLCACSKNGVPCGRRVGVLYGAGRLFACRHCYELAYESQYEDFSGRMMLKAQRLRRKLKASESLGDFYHKPKGMHWKTYERLAAEIREAETLTWTGVAQRFGLFKDRF